MQAGGEASWLRPLEWAVSMVGGAGAAFVFFRTKVGVIETKLEKLIEADKRREREEQRAAAERRSDERVQELRVRNAIASAVMPLERRQMMTLEILADLAEAAGLDKRLGDGLLKMLARERRAERGEESE